MPLTFTDDLPGNPPQKHRLVDAMVVDELRANVGRWAVIRSYRDRSTAAGMVRSLRSYVPDDVEVTRRGCVLYARAVVCEDVA